MIFRNAIRKHITRHIPVPTIYPLLSCFYTETVQLALSHRLEACSGKIPLPEFRLRRQFVETEIVLFTQNCSIAIIARVVFCKEVSVAARGTTLPALFTTGTSGIIAGCFSGSSFVATTGITSDTAFAITSVSSENRPCITRSHSFSIRFLIAFIFVFFSYFQRI